jgi:hypothetical protein
MARKKLPPKRTRHAFVIRSLTLTPAADIALHQLGQEASDELGWKVSSSAIVRALLQQAKQQGPQWARDTLFPLIEKELESGVVWGNRKK